MDAGADRIVELPPGTVTLAGSVTDDGLPASGQLTMQWSMVDRPGPGLPSRADRHPRPPRRSAPQGTYVLRLAASDGALAAHDDVTVVVEPPNAPPSVDAGADQAVALPQTTATLAGTVADDGLPTGGVLTVAWSQVSGPGQVTFGAPSQAADVGHLEPCRRVRPSADRKRRATRPVFDDVTVTVAPANGAPQVDAGPDQAITLPADTVTLTGTVVDDGRPSGVLTHAWAQLSGPAPVVFGDARRSRDHRDVHPARRLSPAAVGQRRRAVRGRRGAASSSDPRASFPTSWSSASTPADWWSTRRRSR